MLCRRATGAPAGAGRGVGDPASDGERGSVGAKPPGSSLETESNGELHLTARSQTYRPPNSTRGHTKRPRRRQVVGLSWLNAVRLCSGLADAAVRQSQGESRTDTVVAEVRRVEKIEDFRSQLSTWAAAGADLLRNDEVHLLEVRTVDRIPFEIPERSRKWHRKRCRVQELATAIRDERIDAGNEVRPARIA